MHLIDSYSADINELEMHLLGIKKFRYKNFVGMIILLDIPQALKLKSVYFLLTLLFS